MSEFAAAAVALLEEKAVYADGSSSAAGGFDVLKAVAVTVTARRVVSFTTDPEDRTSQVVGNETVTVTLQHSDDGESFDDADSNEFDADGQVVLELASPKAFIRVSWALDGDNPQPILTAIATAVPKIITDAASVSLLGVPDASDASEGDLLTADGDGGFGWVTPS